MPRKDRQVAMTQTARAGRRKDMCKWIRANKPTMEQTVAKWKYTTTTIYRACREFNTKPPSAAAAAAAGRGHATTRILSYYLHGGLNQADVAYSLGISRQRVNEVVTAYRKCCDEADTLLDK